MNNSSSTNNQSSPKTKSSIQAPLKGVIFDMDGTLIELNVIDELKRRIYEVINNDPLGKGLERDDLEVMVAKLSPEGQRQAKKAIRDVLQHHIDNMTLQEGGPELVAFLAHKGIRTAVLTRNYEHNAWLMQHKYMEVTDEAEFNVIVGRNTPFDTSDPPEKELSKAQRIHQICAIWGCDPSEVIMLGDSIADDVVEGNKAGCAATILLQPEGYQLNDVYGTYVGTAQERKASLCVESLTEVKQHLECIL